MFRAGQSRAEQGRGRNEYLDIVKYVTIFCVLWGHIVQQAFSMGISDANPYLDGVYRTIYTFHMPLFMGICGYFFSISLSRYHEYFKTKLLTRLKSLIYPMFVFGFLKVLLIAPFSDISLKLYLQESVRVWFLGDLVINTMLILLIASRLNGSLYTDVKYFILMFFASVIPCAFIYSIAPFMYLSFTTGFIVHKYFNEEFYNKVQEYTEVVCFAYIVIYMIYSFSSFSSMGWTINYHKYSLVSILVADISKIILGCLGSFVVLGILWRLMNNIKKWRIYRRAVAMGQYTLDIYLLNIIILEIIGGRYLYPWLCKNIFHENVLMNHGFGFEVVSTFIIAYVFMEILVVISKVLNRYRWIAKLFFYRIKT